MRYETATDSLGAVGYTINMTRISSPKYEMNSCIRMADVWADLASTQCDAKN